MKSDSRQAVYRTRHESSAISISRALPWAYLLLVVLAELLVATRGATVGLTIHALLLVALLYQGAMGRVGPQRDLVIALALAPVTRILSLSLPLAGLHPLAWYPAVGLPLLLAAWSVVRCLGLVRGRLGLQRGAFGPQAVAILVGLAAGILGYLILRPAPLLTPDSGTGLFLLAAAVLLVFAGFTEELVYRGLLLPLASSAMPGGALVFVSLLACAMSLGNRSLPGLALVFGANYLFGVLAPRARSIGGVGVAHGLANIAIYLVLPVVASSLPALPFLAAH